MSAQQIPIDSIKFYPECYPRASTYWGHWYRYAQAIKSGAHFPPIVVSAFKDETVLVDGYHRIEAYKMLKQTKVEAQFIECETKDDILIEATTMNISHGAQLSFHDMMRISAILHKKGKSWDEIGELLHVPTPELRKEMKARFVKFDGSEPVIKKSVTLHSPQPIFNEGEQRLFAAKSQLNLLEQIISLIKGGYIDTTDERVVDKIEELRELLLPLKPTKTKSNKGT